MTDQSSGRPRPFLIRHAALWLVPLSLLFAVLLMEGVLRMFPSLLPIDTQQRLLFLTKSGAPKSVGDPYLGFTYPPFFETVMVSRDFRFAIESDEHGFRNPSPWPDRAEVVVVGDSMAYGYGVASDQAWPTLLDEALPASRVIALGLPGAVPLQYTRYFERFGTPLRPKVLIYTIFLGNDLKESSIFQRWLDAGSPGNYDVWRFFEGAAPIPATVLLDRSLLYMAMNSARKGRAFTGSTTLDLADGGRVQLMPSAYDSSLAINQKGNPAFDSVVRATLEARSRAQAIGCGFIVMFVPTKESVYSASLKRGFPGLNEPMERVLRHDYSIEVIDPTDSLVELAAQGKTLYFEVDGHPNALGNRVIADVVTQYLNSNAQSLGLDDWNQADPRPDLARPR